MEKVTDGQWPKVTVLHEQGRCGRFRKLPVERGGNLVEEIETKDLVAHSISTPLEHWDSWCDTCRLEKRRDELNRFGNTNQY
jgi:hypothetical protein